MNLKYFKLIILSSVIFIFNGFSADKKADEKTGLIIDKGWEQVRDQCGVCHAISMVTQNTGDKQTWKSTINWMYKTQGLWNLSDTEQIIINYLSTNYSPVEFSESNFRRRPVRPEDMPPKYRPISK